MGQTEPHRHSWNVAGVAFFLFRKGVILFFFFAWLEFRMWLLCVFFLRFLDRYVSVCYVAVL